MKRKRNILAALLLLAIPSMAHANAGTAMLMAGYYHLVIGNLIIGILEGILLAVVFGPPKLKFIFYMILANYLSAWVGGFYIAQALVKILPIGLHNLWASLWGMVIFTYLLTLFLEFPLVAAAFSGDPAWLRKSIRGSLLVQTVSYIILFGFYWRVSGASLVTQTEIVELSSIPLPEKVAVYFISADDGDVYAGSLREQQWQKVFDLDSSDRNDRLFVKPSITDTNSWDLMALLDYNVGPEPRIVTVEEEFAVVAAPAYANQSDNPRYDSTWFNAGPVPKLGEAKSSPWEFSTGFWAIAGLRGTQTDSGRKVYFALETPLLMWYVRNATHLPTDKILLQLAKDQICIYDPEKEQIAFLAKGRGPIAVMEKDDKPQMAIPE